MSNSSFFTNNHLSTTGSLFDKFKEMFDEMEGLKHFNAVVGFFRSSGYFKIRQQMDRLDTIKILIGINVDNIFRKHPKNMLFLHGKEVAEEALAIYGEETLKDIREANYSKEIEEGILQLIEDVASGKVELKIHPTKDIHAKFYLFLPQTHSNSNPGCVIMGSSNLSDSGLGIDRATRYELNVELRRYDDVKFCKDEFDKLWKEGEPLKPEDIDGIIKKSYLGHNPTPFEIYMKVLIDYFGDIVEDDTSIELPDGITAYRYQEDAMKQGYAMLKEHNGFFLADVVGLGKTIVAAMIAKRFVSTIRGAKILVIHPPAVSESWKETFKLFKFKNTQVQYVNNGSLSKILNGEANYWAKEEYDLIIVDEAHGFRSDSSERYKHLQTICKTKRENGEDKKVMLISATPLNNRPEDLYNLIQLFQDKRNSTVQINGSSSLQEFFDDKIKRFKEIMGDDENNSYSNDIKKLYDSIRTEVIDKVTVRRTRGNIKKNFPDDFAVINFPNISPPRDVNYKMHNEVSTLFNRTVWVLTIEGEKERNRKREERESGIKPERGAVEGLLYSRYRAIERIKEPIKSDRYPSAEQTSRSLAGIYRVFMVKRLESSFEAFYLSLKSLRDATQGMIKMFEEDKIIIAPDWKGKVRDLMDDNKTLDEIIAMGEKQFGKGDNSSFAVYHTTDFEDVFIDDLRHDVNVLNELIREWKEVRKSGDPKLDVFIDKMKNEIFSDNTFNPTGKLVVFTESKDTLNYLTKELTERLGREDILSVSSENRKNLFDEIRENFDANYKTQDNKYNIIITTDVLAEGVNLHRANVIVNYDTPWNASRLMQRIGRINRIGSVAGTIENYMFYPSNEGDTEINLYKNALAKLQGFHAAFGEDSQIYSKEEIVEYFEFANFDIDESENRRQELLDEVREFRRKHPDHYNSIKKLEPKSRTFRHQSEHTKQNNIEPRTTLAYISSDYKTEFYYVHNHTATVIDFYRAVELFRAKVKEETAPMSNFHHQQVTIAQDMYRTKITNLTDDKPTMPSWVKPDDKEMKKDAQVRKFFIKILNTTTNDDIKRYCEELIKDTEKGTYSALSKKYLKLKKTHQPKADSPLIGIAELEKEITDDYMLYHSTKQNPLDKKGDNRPKIVLSETFV